MKTFAKKYLALLLVAIPFHQALSQNFKLITNWKQVIAAPAGRATGAGNPLPFPGTNHPNSIVAGVGYGVVRLDPTGKELFNFMTAQDVMVPAIGDLTGDGKAEIIVPTTAGTVYCLDENGRQLWQQELKDNLYDFGSAVLSDIDGDGKLEAFFNAKAGTIYCLNSDGTLRWKVMAEPRACNPAVGDIDGDGKAEIFFGTDVSKIFCLDYQGRYLWHTEILNGVYGRSSPTLADLNGDGRYELIMPHSNTTPSPAVAVLDAHSGKLLWKGSTVMQNYGGTSLADLDHDGKLEVVVVDKGNTVNVFGWDGQLKWRTTLSGRGMFFAAGIADFFNDGHLEILCGCRNTGPDGQTMFLLDEQGKILHEFKEGGDRQTSPVIADLNGDQIPEIICSDVAQKCLICYSMEGAKAGGAIPWSCWKKSPDNSSFLPTGKSGKVAMEIRKPVSLAPVEPISGLIGLNYLNISLPANSKGTDLLCETRITDGHRIVRSDFYWIEAQQDYAEIPYCLNAAEIQNLECIIRNRTTGEVLLSKRYKVNATGYLQDRNFVKTAEIQLRKFTEQLPPSDFSLGGSLKSVITQAKELFQGINEIHNPNQLAAAHLAMETNRQKIDFALKYGGFVNRIRQKAIPGTFFAWQVSNPWNSKKLEDQFPAKVLENTTRAEVLAMGNEIEDIAYGITNLKETAQTIKMYPHNLTDEKGKQINFREVVELHEAIPTVNGKGEWTDEAVPILNQANTMHLGALESRKLWINLNTRNLAPGKYTFSLGLESIGNSPSVQNIEISLKVSSVRVPEKNEFAFNTWSSIEIADDQMRAKVVKDLLDHKIGVLSMLPGPRFYLDREGKLKEDWAHWDQLYTPLKDQIVCFVTSALSVEINGQKVTKEDYATLLKEAYRLAHKGMADRGITREQWAIYVMDEPALTGYPSILQAVNIANEIRAASPEMELYIDPAGMVTPETMKAFEGLIDIYSPQIDLLKDPDGKLLDYFHSLNKRLWCYEAPSPGRSFHPLGHYRTQAWLSFEYGLTGCGFWCYNSNNLNNVWRMNAPDDYDAVYNDGTTIVPSRRWEASRDGVEDYHLLMMLKRKIAACKEGTAPQKALALKTEADMMPIVRGITSRVKKIKEISRDFIPYEIDYSQFEEGRKLLIGYLEEMDRY